MKAQRPASGRKDEPKGIHWLQAIGWGISLSLVMFGFGLLVGMRLGERNAGEKGSGPVVQPIAAQLLPREEEVDLPADEASGVWDILEDKGSPPLSMETPLTEKPIDVPEPSSVETSTHEIEAARELESAGSNCFCIQVASFRDGARAEAYKKELVEKGYPYPRIVKAEIPDRGIWHRVRIGRCESKADAERIAKEIQKLERLEPQVLLEEN